MTSVRTAFGLALLVVLGVLLYRRDVERTADSPERNAPQAIPAPPRSRPEAPNVPSDAGSAAPRNLIGGLLEDQPVTLPPPVSLASSTEPLPAWDATLVDVLPALRARADAGDIDAACHLGLALSACALHLAFQPSAAKLRQVDPDDSEAMDRIAWSSNDLRRPGREASCAGLTRAQLLLRVDYLQRAADAGHRAAMLAYADGMHLQSVQDWIRHPEHLEQYMQRAPRFIDQLIRRGDRFTAFLMALHADGLRVSFLAQSLSMDQETTATFWHLSRLVMPRAEQGFRVFPPEIDQRGRARAQQLHARYFDGRPWDSDEFRRRGDQTRVENCVEAR